MSIRYGQEYICSTKPNGDEYINATLLFKRIDEEIALCNRRIEETGNDYDRFEARGKLNAFELVKAVMVGLWNGDEVLYIQREAGTDCAGCTFAGRKRPQKCACCSRNQNIKDCFQKENT